MSSAPGTPEEKAAAHGAGAVVPPKSRLTLTVLHLPLNVYLLLFFTLGKGFQLSISTLTVNYYAHSLGYRPDFIGLLSAMPALGSLVSAIEASPDWSSTAVFITFDDCGCFYDHVTPPSGLGIRLPLVIVSPYAKQGFTDHNVATHSSILAYIEKTLGVSPVSEEDRRAYDFHESFNYSTPSRVRFVFRPAAVPPSSGHLHPPPDAT